MNSELTMTKGKHFNEFMLRGSNMNNTQQVCYYVLVLFVKVQLKQVLGHTYSWGRANRFLVLSVFCAIFDAMRIDGSGATEYKH